MVLSCHVVHLCRTWVVYIQKRNVYFIFVIQNVLVWYCSNPKTVTTVKHQLDCDVRNNSNKFILSPSQTNCGMCIAYDEYFVANGLITKILDFHTYDLFTNVREQCVDAGALRILTIFIITLDESFATNFLSSQLIMTYQYGLSDNLFGNSWWNLNIFILENKNICLKWYCKVFGVLQRRNMSDPNSSIWNVSCGFQRRQLILLCLV